MRLARELPSMTRRWLLPAMAALSLTLVGCAGSDNRNEPRELTEFTPTVQTNVAWRVPVGSETTYGFAPVVVGDTVYAASSDGKVTRIDGSAGAAVWNKQIAPKLAAGVGADANTVAVVTPRGEVIALDVNGEEKWRAQASSEVSVVPWVGNGVVVVRAGDYRVQAFNAANGERIWNVQRPGPALALRAPARMNTVQDLVLVGMPGGRLLAIVPGSGAVVWEGIVAVPRGASDLERVNDVVGEPLVIGDLLCAVAYQGRATCFNAAEGGRTVWANNISSIVGPAADEARLYVPDSRDRVHAFGLQEGDAIWMQDALLNRRLSEPAVVNDTVVTGAFDGYVHALSATTGELAARLSIGGGSIVAPVQTLNGGALVQSGDSTVVLIRFN